MYIKKEDCAHLVPVLRPHWFTEFFQGDDRSCIFFFSCFVCFSAKEKKILCGREIFI